MKLIVFATECGPRTGKVWRPCMDIQWIATNLVITSFPFKNFNITSFGVLLIGNFD